MEAANAGSERRIELLRQIERGGCSVAVPDLRTWRVEDRGNEKFVRVRQAEITGNCAEI